MEEIVTLAILLLVALLAARIGHDNRDGLRSHEHDLARRGLTWVHKPTVHVAAFIDHLYSRLRMHSVGRGGEPEKQTN